MNWHISWRADPRARAIADRHYNRQKIGAPQFVPPGRSLVLLTPDADALWITSWPFAEFVKHRWGGAWMCSAFRNEGSLLSSTLIREAVAATRAVWSPPALGMVTFVNDRLTRRRRGKLAIPGECFFRAGWLPCGMTAGGLHALRLAPEAMPDPEPAIGSQAVLFGATS